MRHFVTLIEIRVYLIRVNPGHICQNWPYFGKKCCFTFPDRSYCDLSFKIIL